MLRGDNEVTIEKMKNGLISKEVMEMENEEVGIKEDENNHEEMCMELIQTGIADNVVQGILSLSLYGENYNEIQRVLITYSKHEHENIRAIAILGFGHIARRFGRINKPIMLSIIKEGLKDRSCFVRGHANVALEDILHFVK